MNTGKNKISSSVNTVEFCNQELIIWINTQNINNRIHIQGINLSKRGMFHFKNKIKNARKEREKKNSDLTYDNVAIPEVHKAASDATTHTAEEQNSSKDEHTSSVSFDNVAIPEVHIRRKK